MSSDETHTREEIEDARPWVQTWQSPPSSQTLGEAIAHLAETVNAEPAFPKPCGRLDRHDAHEWVAPEGTHRSRAYRCTGRLLLEGGYWADWDAADDAAEDQAERDRHDAIDQQIEVALRAGWGR